MNKDEYAALLTDIGGGTPIIGERARRERLAAEQQVFNDHENRFWALLCLGDAVHQFYRDTLDIIANTVATKPLNGTEFAMVHWHLVSFARFAGAFDLLARGYYFDAITLARGLWEVALSLAALHKGVITLEELTGSAAATPQEMEQLSRRADSKVRRLLITENPLVSSDAREAVITFIGLANLATHKSKLHMALNLRRVQRGEPIPLFPKYHEEEAGAASNVVYLAAWALVATVPHVRFALPANDAPWWNRHAQVMKAFEQGPGRGPNPVVQAWPDVIRTILGS